MTLVKKGWTSPFNNNYLSDFFNGDKFLNDEFFATERMPAVNIVENDASYELEVAVPGMNKEDFKIEVKEGRLTIFAETKEEKKEEDKNYYRKEFSCSSFSRMFSLPEGVKDVEIDAVYKNGILFITIPKSKHTVVPVKRVEVK